jgi:acyl-CoA synthetase (AMP-forming)/AMP-acid ligase II
MNFGTGGHISILDILEQHALQRAEHPAFIYLQNGEIEQRRLSYAELRHRAAALSIRLARDYAPGARVVIALPDGIEFVIFFMGCLYAGLVPVPVKAPHNAESSVRLSNITDDCTPHMVIMCPKAIAQFRAACPESAAQSLVHDIDAYTELEADAPLTDAPLAATRHGQIAASDLAFLQYTSGSTGAPKGVMVSHANLLANEAMITAAWYTHAGDVFVSWLPLFHDMGLIGTVLQPIFVGATCVMMTPASFVLTPVRWLAAITKYRGTITGGPNFAFRMLSTGRTLASAKEVDLSSLRILYCGSEPISRAVVDRFIEAYVPRGFNPASFKPSYGLAEATLMASGGSPGAPRYRDISLAGGAGDSSPSDSADLKRKTAISCGFPVYGEVVRIANPITLAACKENEVGEILLRGAHIARGYWNKPAVSEAVFGAEVAGEAGVQYMRTGDLGFLSDGELFVTGRIKEVIIFNGSNYYPQDIEETSAGSHEAANGMRAVAFGVADADLEQITIVQELKREFLGALDTEALDHISRSIKAAVLARHGLPVKNLIYVRQNTIPKTTSGKICRGTTRKSYEAGVLDRISIAHELRMPS